MHGRSPRRPFSAVSSSAAVDPGGRALYVTSAGSGHVQIFDIDVVDGSLVPSASVAVGERPISISLSADGTTAAVANYGSGDVSLLQVDPCTGALSPAGRVAVGRGPTATVWLSP